MTNNDTDKLKAEINRIARLSTEQLYGLIGNKYKATAKSKWVKRGKERFDNVAKSLYQKICQEWDGCDKIQQADFNLVVNLTSLVSMIATLIQAIVAPGLTLSFAVLLVTKIGLDKFCNCPPSSMVL